LLLINPNCSAHITERLAQSARAALARGDMLTAVTAQGHPAVVRSAVMLGQADANALALLQQHAAGHDAVLLGISLDRAAPQLRHARPNLPVLGMTEAALLTACLCSERIGLLTLGASLLQLYRERVEGVGVASRVVAYEAPESELAFAIAGPLVDPQVLEVLVHACRRLHGAGAQAVVLAGAVLCGYARPLRQRCGMPVFDGVDCAVRQLQVLRASLAATQFKSLASTTSRFR
jgi:allantoin racemase